MNKQSKLILERAIFTLIVFVSFGVIIVNEKINDILIPKVQEKMDTYLNENYKNIKNDIIKQDIKYKNKTYSMKVISKKNSNHYFYIKYSNKKITDTYNNDYLKGNCLFKHLKLSMEKEIKTKTSTTCNIKINNPLNQYTSKVQEKIISEDNLLNLKFYTIEKDLTVTWDKKSITSSIKELINQFNSNSITPKSYTITITNKEDITEAIKISNLNEDFLNTPLNEQIIENILNNSNEEFLNKFNIKYQYLN